MLRGVSGNMITSSKFFFYVAILAIVCMLLYNALLETVDFEGIGRIIWYQYIEVPLPPQTVPWLHDWKDKSHKLANMGVPLEIISKIQQNLPNILFILADDLGYNDLSDYSWAPDAHGPRLGAKTSHINSIREHGVDFAQSYSGHSSCTPSRAALLTGRISTKLGIEFTPTPPLIARLASYRRGEDEVQPIFHQEFFKSAPHLHNLTIINHETAMMAQFLDHAGYHSYYLGKWDSGYGPDRAPRRRGYDESLCFPYGASQYSKPRSPDIVTPSEFHVDLDSILTATLSFFVQYNDGPRFHPDRYMTDYLTYQGVQLIKQLATKNSPWHIMMAYNAPHNPFQARREDYNHPDLAHVPLGIPRIYAAMIRALDRGVGQLIEALKETNQYENTLIIFSSDNGGAEYTGIKQVNSPFRGWKFSLFEGGIRVPFFLQWPRLLGHKGNHDELGHGLQKVNAVTSHIDVVPTLIDIIDNVIAEHTTVPSIAKPHPENLYQKYEVDGKSFWDYVQQAAGANDSRKLNYEAPSHRTLFWRSGHYKAIRVGDWKLQVALHPNKVWFVDLAQDPTEQDNLAISRFQLSQQEDLKYFCHNSVYEDLAGTASTHSCN